MNEMRVSHFFYKRKMKQQQPALLKQLWEHMNGRR